MEFFSIGQDGDLFDGDFLHIGQGARMSKTLTRLIPRLSRPEMVGPRVTAIRETLGMQKAEFADQIGLDRSSLTKIEKGEMGLDIARGEVIAALFKFGLDYIYRGDLSDVPSDKLDALLLNAAKGRTIQ